MFRGEERLLALGMQDLLVIWRLDADGQPFRQERALFVDSLAALPDEAALVNGMITLRISGDAFVDKVAVTTDGYQLFVDDFEDGDFAGWETRSTIRDLYGTVVGGSMHKKDSAWQEFRLEADAGLGRKGGIGLTISTV